MSGWRKRTIMEMAQEAGLSDERGWIDAHEAGSELEAFAKLVREEALAQPAPVQEFVCSTGLCHYKSAAPAAPVQYELSPTDIYDFAGWLTTRRGVMKVGSSCEAGPMAEAVGEYLKTFPDRFTPPQRKENK